eukprot:TRINITY_DN35422_c0_g1_i1.p1 TRINITY_DN35422_c0_g1~~TRINITY_DN35422_c0_g1_i1.p1  ORF type:complete len:223 (+),score=33.20 TRINITY_DN35422_c0_g1_i1:81-749(+)
MLSQHHPKFHRCHGHYQRSRFSAAAVTAVITAMLVMSATTFVGGHLTSQACLRQRKSVQFQQRSRQKRSPRFAVREEMIAAGGGNLIPIEDLQPLSRGDLYLNTVVFILFCVPFLYAAWEFWRRIAFGQSFGTGDVQVVFPKPGEGPDPLTVKQAPPPKKQRPVGKPGKVTIGMDSDTNRGRMVMGQDSLALAYILTGLAGGSIVWAAWVAWPAFSGQVPLA